MYSVSTTRRHSCTIFLELVEVLVWKLILSFVPESKSLLFYLSAVARQRGAKAPVVTKSVGRTKPQSTAHMHQVSREACELSRTLSAPKRRFAQLWRFGHPTDSV